MGLQVVQDSRRSYLRNNYNLFWVFLVFNSSLSAVHGSQIINKKEAKYHHRGKVFHVCVCTSKIAACRISRADIGYTRKLGILLGLPRPIVVVISPCFCRTKVSSLASLHQWPTLSSYMVKVSWLGSSEFFMFGVCCNFGG